MIVRTSLSIDVVLDLFLSFKLYSSEGKKSGFGKKSGLMPSRHLIKKIRSLLYSKYPPSGSKSGLIIEVGHREGC